MYKANRRDGLCERSLTMFPVGIDVSKNTLDLFMLYDGIKGRIKTRNIQNNRHSVENILRWLRSTHRVNACHFCLNFFSATIERC